MQMERKTEILDAFMRLVCRFGLDKTTMQDVAKEAGISVGSIYNDFKNKEELIDAFVCRIQEQLMNRSKRLLEQDHPAEQLLHGFIVEFFLLVAETVRDNRGFLQLLKGEETFKYFRKNFKKHDLMTREVHELIAQVLERGVREGVFEVDDYLKTARLFFSAFSEYAKLMVFSEDPTETLADVEEMYAFVSKAIRRR
ncbi:TetR family transcriptional regulator [Hydrogenispora ethanolica]|jgi:AcrR family transcriptional regulator|uniref:TetR family transcriptional regulator n=1 Tax=Hydrogenispora ethanolica TaxID=1082276 RepID=A0A4R1RYK4_HYDET|nr:TetR/AcrR family transcriptional regulator [Hydrogenispora ethanolica]TCL71594.1 TetR family transcriptional regulator [Hydrogenispora ethanolica]